MKRLLERLGHNFHGGCSDSRIPVVDHYPNPSLPIWMFIDKSCYDRANSTVDKLSQAARVSLTESVSHFIGVGGVDQLTEAGSSSSVAVFLWHDINVLPFRWAKFPDCASSRAA